MTPHRLGAIRMGPPLGQQQPAARVPSEQDILNIVAKSTDDDLLIIWESLKLTRAIQAKTRVLAESVTKFRDEISDARRILLELEVEVTKLSKAGEDAKVIFFTGKVFDAMAARGIRVMWKDFLGLDINGVPIITTVTNDANLKVSAKRFVEFDFSRPLFSDRERLVELKKKLSPAVLGIAFVPLLYILFIGLAIGLSLVGEDVTKVLLGKDISEALRKALESLGKAVGTATIILGIGVAATVVIVGLVFALRS